MPVTLRKTPARLARHKKAERALKASPSRRRVGRARSPSDDRENWGDATSGSAASSSEAAAGRLPYEPISLSFSGGGIRSCAMSSGVLCWLEAHGFCTEQEGLTTIDDISSVSGGGYTAASYVLWRHRNEGRGEVQLPRENGAVPGTPEFRPEAFTEALEPRNWVWEYFEHLSEHAGYFFRCSRAQCCLDFAAFFGLFSAWSAASFADLTARAALVAEALAVWLSVDIRNAFPIIPQDYCDCGGYAFRERYAFSKNLSTVEAAVAASCEPGEPLAVHRDDWSWFDASSCQIQLLLEMVHFSRFVIIPAFAMIVITFIMTVVRTLPADFEQTVFVQYPHDKGERVAPQRGKWSSFRTEAFVTIAEMLLTTRFAIGFFTGVMISFNVVRYLIIPGSVWWAVIIGLIGSSVVSWFYQRNMRPVAMTQILFGVVFAARINLGDGEGSGAFTSIKPLYKWLDPSVPWLVPMGPDEWAFWIAFAIVCAPLLGVIGYIRTSWWGDYYEWRLVQAFFPRDSSGRAHRGSCPSPWWYCVGSRAPCMRSLRCEQSGTWNECLCCQAFKRLVRWGKAPELSSIRDAKPRWHANVTAHEWTEDSILRIEETDPLNGKPTRFASRWDFDPQQVSINAFGVTRLDHPPRRMISRTERVPLEHDVSLPYTPISNTLHVSNAMSVSGAAVANSLGAEADKSSSFQNIKQGVGLFGLGWGDWVQPNMLDQVHENPILKNLPGAVVLLPLLAGFVGEGVSLICRLNIPIDFVAEQQAAVCMGISSKTEFVHFVGEYWLRVALAASVSVGAWFSVISVPLQVHLSGGELRSLTVMPRFMALSISQVMKRVTDRFHLDDVVKDDMKRGEDKKVRAATPLSLAHFLWDVEGQESPSLLRLLAYSAADAVGHTLAVWCCVLLFVFLIFVADHTRALLTGTAMLVAMPRDNDESMVEDVGLMAFGIYFLKTMFAQWSFNEWRWRVRRIYDRKLAEHEAQVAAERPTPPRKRVVGDRLQVDEPVGYNPSKQIRLPFGLDDPSRVYFSDGGHTENLGVLALLRLRKKRIIAVDGGCDKYRVCAAFKSALALARKNLNVEFFSPQDNQKVDVQQHLQEMLVENRVARSIVLRVRYTDYVGAEQGKRERVQTWGTFVYLKARSSRDGNYAAPHLSDDFSKSLTVMPPSEVLQGLPGSSRRHHFETSHAGCNQFDQPEQQRRLHGCCFNWCQCSNPVWAFVCKRIWGAFPQHTTANQLFSPTLHRAYHQQGYLAMNWFFAKANMKDPDFEFFSDQELAWVNSLREADGGGSGSAPGRKVKSK